MGDGFCHGAMRDNEPGSSLSVILILRPQLPQSRLLPLRCRGLRGQAAKDQLAGKIKPMPGKRVDDLAPHSLLELVEIRRRLRTTTPRKHRHDGKRGCGFTTAGHARVPFQIERQRLTRNPPVRTGEKVRDPGRLPLPSAPMIHAHLCLSEMINI
jgi:hypothetical protein